MHWGIFVEKYLLSGFQNRHTVFSRKAVCRFSFRNLKKCLTNSIKTYIIVEYLLLKRQKEKILLISEVFKDEENLSAKEASEGERTRFQKKNGYCIRQKSFV